MSLGLSSPAVAQPARGAPPPLKSLTTMPVGQFFWNDELKDPDFAPLLLRNYSQITPGFEMKMGPIVKADGSYNFGPADRIMNFARQNALRVHGHTLVWYRHQPTYFMGLDGKSKAFADAYRDCILAIAGHYRGQLAGWDVVNEPVNDDGSGLRDCLWSKNLGQEEYMLQAFRHARQADPSALLFINEFDLEKKPQKRATFLALVERLLKRGASIDGIGSQTHINIDLPDGACADAFRDIASLGLKVHLSELDVSQGRANWRDLRSDGAKSELQARKTAQAVEAFMALPAKQRYALTVCGLRDKDSWIYLQPGPGHLVERPLPFDDAGQPKPMFWALADGLRGARSR